MKIKQVNGKANKWYKYIWQYEIDWKERWPPKEVSPTAVSRSRRSRPQVSRSTLIGHGGLSGATKENQGAFISNSADL
jgi:hypothetical protein